MRSLLCLSLVVLVGCASSAKDVKPESDTRSSGANAAAAGAMADALKLAALSQQAQLEAQRACAPLLNTETSRDEEHAIGKMLAVMFVANSGHLSLDGADEKDPEKLSRDLAERKTLTLPEGGKNAISAHVALVGKNLARFSARPQLPWVFGVIENDTPNAFNAPGGYVFVTTGLLKKVSNEAQLAGVLAHEIGHVVHKHSLAKYRDAEHKQCIAAKYAAYLIEHAGGPRSPMLDEVARYARNFDVQIDLDHADAGFSSFIMKALLMLTQLGNSKEDELKADRAALELVCFAGYEPSEYEKLLTALGPGLTSSHPAVSERVAALTALRQGELKDFATGSAKPDLGKVFAPLSK